MKKLILTLTLGIGLISCQNLQEGNDVQATYNCETVRSSIDNFQNEVATYDEFSADFVSAQTGYNPTGDSTSLDKMKENRTKWWACI